MRLPLLADNKSCTACCACVAICKRQALTKKLQGDGHYYILLNSQKCIQCGACEKVCPIVNEKEYGNNNANLTVPYKGYSELVSYKTNGTSGGVFGAIAYNFIKNGGIVIGATLQNNLCRYVAINKIEDINLLQGSKYIYSHPEAIYSEIKKALNENKKVLFSGIPCHTAGILSFFSKHPQKENLYTIDLVCGGIPSKLLLDEFLKQHVNAQIKSFRQKHQYKLSYSQDGKEKNAGYRNQLISGYISGLTNRYSCYHCHFAFLHRESDLTLGDYWQATKNQHNQSLILEHSKKGKELLSNENINKTAAEWKDFLPFNPKIVIRDIHWDTRWERKYLSFLHKSLSSYLFNLVYASIFKKYDILGIGYLIYKKIRWHIEMHKRKIKIDIILHNLKQYRNK